jgi:ABC-2 type transport system ATP-binding protein
VPGGDRRLDRGSGAAQPTTGLDPTGRGDLWAVIDELVADGTTVLLTTQYLEEADRHADRIVVM